MSLLNDREQGNSRARHVQCTILEPTEQERHSFDDVKEALVDSVRNYHFVKGRPLYIFLDASKAWGFGTAVYQSIATDNTTHRQDLRPICFLSRQITGAETHYWPTDLELAGLVWAVKKLRIYIEQTPTTIYMDHHSNASIYAATSLRTTSPAKLNLRQQSWANYLSQFRDSMIMAYKAGSLMTVPDVLSRLKARLETETESANQPSVYSSNNANNNELGLDCNSSSASLRHEAQIHIVILLEGGCL